MIFVDAFLKTALIATLVLAALGDIRKKEVTAMMIIMCGIIAAADAGVMLLMHSATLPYIALSLIPGIVMLLISRVTGQGLGYGDGLIAICAAPALGIQKTAFGLILAVFLAGILSLFLLGFGKANGKTRLPFIPFMAVGMGVMVLAKI